MLTRANYNCLITFPDSRAATNTVSVHSSSNKLWGTAWPPPGWEGTTASPVCAFYVFALFRPHLLLCVCVRGCVCLRGCVCARVSVCMCLHVCLSTGVMTLHLSVWIGTKQNASWELIYNAVNWVFLRYYIQATHKEQAVQKLNLPTAVVSEIYSYYSVTFWWLSMLNGSVSTRVQGA